jgi:hypothetical protein
MRLVRSSSRFSRLLLLESVILALAAACGGSGSPTGPSASVTGTGVTTYTYTTDIRPIMSADCTSCHNASQRDGGYDFSTYAGVLRAASAGQAASPIVVQTRPGQVMYAHLSGDRTHKAEVIYDWVVNSNVAQ